MKQTTWTTYTHEQMQELKDITERYKSCLDAGKTERECVELSVHMAEKAGYRDLKAVMAAGDKLKAGDKIYAVNMDKMLALFRIGEEPLSAGMNILGAHIDSPRIDVKQNPLYENEGFAYLDTHYYGGIKKYQWVAQPLSLHGVIVKKDGTVQKVAIGEDESDPVFVITDLLVHLAQEQLEKKASKVIDGEKLDLLIGNCPLDGAVEDKEQKEAVKANILKLLKNKYDMDEEDFSSAELEIVPAGRARDCGMDRSMILSYGQDDRVCAFTSLFAMLDVTEAKKTGCCLLVDKEEIGSVGATGMHSRFFENTAAPKLGVRKCCSTYDPIVMMDTGSPQLCRYAVNKKALRRVQTQSADSHCRTVLIQKFCVLQKFCMECIQIRRLIAPEMRFRDRQTLTAALALPFKHSNRNCIA